MREVTLALLRFLAILALGTIAAIVGLACAGGIIGCLYIGFTRAPALTGAILASLLAFSALANR